MRVADIIMRGVRYYISGVEISYIAATSSPQFNISIQLIFYRFDYNFVVHETIETHHHHYHQANNIIQ